jgi:hypothetical protein
MEVFMKFITKIGVACATAAMMASTMSYAGTVTSSQLNDHYIGADGNSTSDKDYSPYNPDAHYDIHWMQVARTIDGNQGSLSVTVNSNFVEYNSQSGFSFGDLFIMDAASYQLADACTDVAGNGAYGCNEYSEKTTSGSTANVDLSPNKWEYAFDLGGTGSNSARNYSNVNNETGRLREIDQSNYNSQVISTDSNREWQAIVVSNNADVTNYGKWGTNVAQNLLTMTFDISGTSLMDAAQLALRWQMTCANDIIEVVTNFKPNKPPGGGTAVPEPSTFVLMLLAVFGIFASRQKKAIGFKA